MRRMGKASIVERIIVFQYPRQLPVQRSQLRRIGPDWIGFCRCSDSHRHFSRRQANNIERRIERLSINESKYIGRHGPKAKIGLIGRSPFFEGHRIPHGVLPGFHISQRYTIKLGVFSAHLFRVRIPTFRVTHTRAARGDQEPAGHCPHQVLYKQSTHFECFLE